MDIDPLASLLLRFGFGLLYLSALAHKLRNFDEFSAVVSAYLKGMRLGNVTFARGVGVAVVALEMAALISLAVPTDATWRVLAVATPLLAYSIGMSVNILFGNRLEDCGCSWGSAKRSVTPAVIVRNLLLSGLCLGFLLPLSGREIGALDVIAVGFGTLVAGLLYASVSALIANPGAARG